MIPRAAFALMLLICCTALGCSRPTSAIEPIVPPSAQSPLPSAALPDKVATPGELPSVYDKLTEAEVDSYFRNQNWSSEIAVLFSDKLRIRVQKNPSSGRSELVSLAGEDVSAFNSLIIHYGAKIYALYPEEPPDDDFRRTKFEKEREAATGYDYPHASSWIIFVLPSGDKTSGKQLILDLNASPYIRSAEPMGIPTTD